MDGEEDIVSSLGGFALEQFLGAFTGEDGISSSSLSAVGLASSSSRVNAGGSGGGHSKVDASQIYGGRFVDDDEDEDGNQEQGEDWEDEVDKELEMEMGMDMDPSLSTTTSSSTLQLPKTTPTVATAKGGGGGATTSLMRGEDEDFDDDDDEDGNDNDNDGVRQSLNNQNVNGLPTGLSFPVASHGIQVKQEDIEGDEDPGNSNNQPAYYPPLQQEQRRRRQDEEMTVDHDETEDAKVDAEELAAQQALFAQSYARMQAQQSGDVNGASGGDASQLPASSLIDVKSVYPSFSPDKVLNFTDLFHPRSRKRAKVDPDVELYPLPQPQNYSTKASTRDFRSRQVFDRSSTMAQYLLDVLIEEAQGSSDEEGLNKIDVGDGAFERLVENANAVGWRLPAKIENEADRLQFEDWEDDIVWDQGSSHRRKRGQLVNGHVDGLNSVNGRDARHPVGAPQHNGERFGFRNPDIESGDWLRSIIWSSTAPFRDFSRLQLSLNDPAGPASSLNKPADGSKNIVIRAGTGWSRDPFNLSNDKLYEVRREMKRTVRQTFGRLEVQHAYPAMKLQFPWYKTQLSKPELRSFHRLPIQFPTNIRLSFSKVRSAKKKKDKTGRKLKKDSVGAEAFRAMGDLSLSQTGQFVLFEFSEENPVIIPNVGMGSIIVNYYRKTDAADSYVPREELGEPFLLDPSDESPFMRFGQVEPGQMVPALYNNLVRAPLFKHQPYDTDFVVVKTTINNETKFYVRDFKHLFVVGQTYPLTDVPGPQSRKLTATAKHRLQSIAYKLVIKNPRRRVKINKLLKYFPDQTEMQMRQRLKEFMEYNRAGDDQRFWKIKDGKMPSEDELFKLIRPENVVLAESTQVGQRNLLDAGLSSTVDEDKGKENEASTLDIRQQLAPWFTTKNFLNAAQNKAMLKLHGEGDPSSRGEGFSFLRVSMKDIFLRAGERLEDRLAEIEARPKSAHRYNVAEQQAIYRAEIDRIWRSQYEALSSPYEPPVTEEDELRWRQEEIKMESGASAALNAFTPADGMSMSPGASRSVSPSAIDAQLKGPPKALRIRRLINGTWTSEIVRDQGVIKGYLRQRQTIEADEEEDPESLVLTGDPEHDAQVRKKLAEHLEKLRKNQERRLQRKNAKKGGTGDVFLPGGKKIKNETTRKCGNCGQIGHMKTNRKCPKWAEFNAANNQQPGANAPSAPANPFAVGLPGLSGVAAGSP